MRIAQMILEKISYVEAEEADLNNFLTSRGSVGWGSSGAVALHNAVTAREISHLCLPCEDVEKASERLQKEALSTEHLTYHGKKNPYCKICVSLIVRQ